MSDASPLVPPMIFSYHWALFLCAAYDSGATYVDGCRGSLDTLLILGTLLTTSGRVYHHPSLEARYSSLLCLFVVSSPPFHRRGGLSGTSLWHIARPVLQCSSPPLIYPAWVLPSPFYDPSMIAFLHFLWATPDWPACGILSGLSSGSSSLIFLHLLPYLSPIPLQSSLAPHQASWYFGKSPLSWTSLTSSPFPYPLTLILYRTGGFSHLVKHCSYSPLSLLALVSGSSLRLLSIFHPLPVSPVSLRPTQWIFPLYDSRTMS